VVTTLTLITGNPGKLAEARRILGREAGFELEAVSIDLPEIQSLDMEEILRAKGEEAWRRLGRPVVVEETGLELEALGGFPGPLVKWMLHAVGAAGIARTALALGDARATARCALLYRDASRVVVGEGAVRGEVVLPPRGQGGFGWDPIFRPVGEAGTYAEMASELKDSLGHRGQAWRDLLARLAG
jgi:non-canonical purine NTP pyrophosphatase (RdgB/HAM1 family)